MRFTVIGVYGSQYLFYQQNGQFFYYMGNSWVPCTIQGIRDVSPYGITIDVGKPILVAFPNPQYNFYTEPVSKIDITM